MPEGCVANVELIRKAYNLRQFLGGCCVEEASWGRSGDGLPLLTHEVDVS